MVELKWNNTPPAFCPRCVHYREIREDEDVDADFKCIAYSCYVTIGSTLSRDMYENKGCSRFKEKE